MHALIYNYTINYLVTKYRSFVFAEPRKNYRNKVTSNRNLIHPLFPLFLVARRGVHRIAKIPLLLKTH